VRAKLLAYAAVLLQCNATELDIADGQLRFCDGRATDLTVGAVLAASEARARSRRLPPRGAVARLPASRSRKVGLPDLIAAGGIAR
jgi:hypothetical protein